MTDAEWDSLDLKGKIEALSDCANIFDGLRDADLMRRIVQIGEDKLSIDTILRTVLKWGEET